MGGPQHVAANDKYPYLPAVEAAICKAVEGNIPYLGLCLGGQLLAHSLGASVTRHHMAEIGFSRMEFTGEGKNDPLFQGLPGCLQVIPCHQNTFDLPIHPVPTATGTM